MHYGHLAPQALAYVLLSHGVLRPNKIQPDNIEFLEGNNQKMVADKYDNNKPLMR
jgi:hypothetical protein